MLSSASPPAVSIKLREVPITMLIVQSRKLKLRQDKPWQTSHTNAGKARLDLRPALLGRVIYHLEDSGLSRSTPSHGCKPEVSQPRAQTPTVTSLAPRKGVIWGHLRLQLSIPYVLKGISEMGGQAWGPGSPLVKDLCDLAGGTRLPVRHLIWAGGNHLKFWNENLTGWIYH